VSAPQPPDLHTLLRQFVALRHGVNLQTKTSRTQQEQNAEALRQLGEALELLQRQQEALAKASEQPRAEELRPLLKTLIDLYDALSLARREVQRVQEAIAPLLVKVVAYPDVAEPPDPRDCFSPPPTPAKQSFWRRLFGGGATTNPEWLNYAQQLRLASEAVKQHQEERSALRQWHLDGLQAAERIHAFVTSLVTGYTMSTQRLERALRQHDLEPIATVGQPFDPETMEVVDVVIDRSRASTEVIEEVRRGYLWRGRVFRFAQVRVAKP